MKGWGFETAFGVWWNYSRRHDTRNNSDNLNKLTIFGAIKKTAHPRLNRPRYAVNNYSIYAVTGHFLIGVVLKICSTLIFSCSLKNFMAS